MKCALLVARLTILLVARRKLTLVAAEVADAMLADVLQQMPFLTVCVHSTV